VYAAKNVARISAGKKAWDASHPEKRQEYGRNKRLKKYGLTPAEAEALFTSQFGKCPICERPGVLGRAEQDAQARGEVMLVVDHCHKTGKVRALLCNTCNTMVGNHEPALLRRGADFVKQHAA
jgi:hypothetical protein